MTVAASRDYLGEAKAASARLNDALYARAWLVTPAALLICALVIFLRKPDAFTHAQFWAEDGPVWFSQAYNHGLWATILQPYSGTLGVVPRFVAYLGSPGIDVDTVSAGLRA